MPIEWTGPGPELMLRVDRSRPEPLRAQLENALRDAIRSGRLARGERIPSSRELARQLGLSRGLVLDCYTQLHAEGYLSTRPRSATRVSGGGGAAAPEPARVRDAQASPAIDFATGVPDLAGFPRADWLWAQRESCRTAPAAALNYGEPGGSPVLRRVLAGYLRRVRDASAEERDLAICTGTAQGLALVSRVLVRAGVDRVAFEEPGYGQGETMTLMARIGVQAVPVPVDEFGADHAHPTGRPRLAVRTAFAAAVLVCITSLVFLLSQWDR